MLREDFKLDQKYRKEVEKIILKIDSYLRSHSVDYVKLRLEKKLFPSIKIPMEYVDKKYKNLIIYLTSWKYLPNNIKNFITKTDSGYYIMISSNEDNIKDIMTNPSIHLRKASSGLYHELIHYLDYSRTKDPTYNKGMPITRAYKKIKKDDFSEYVNEPLEYNAYTQTAYQSILTLIKREKIKFSDFKSFWEYIINRDERDIKMMFDKEIGVFYNFTREYKKKFLKRIYSLYMGLKTHGRTKK